MYARKPNVLRILIYVLVAVMSAALLGGAIFGIMKLVEYNNSETKSPSLNWQVGALDANGDYRATKGSIYTKDPFDCQGLTVELDFEANVSYQIYFYDSEVKFISSTAVMTDNFKSENIPVIAAKARIVVTPKNDNDISSSERRSYAKQLTITVLKEQSGVSDKVVLTYEDGVKVYADFELKVNEDKSAKEQYKTSKPVNLSGYTKICVFDKSPFCVYFGDKDGKNIGDQYKIYMKAEVYEIDIPVGAVYVRFAAPFAPVDNHIENAIIYLLNT